MSRTWTASPADRPPMSALLLVAIIVVLAVLPLFVPSFYLFLLTRILILGLFATAFNIVFGLGGMPSLGHAAFFGTGAYVAAIATTKTELPFAAVLVLTLVAGTVLGIVFGLFNLRARGIYLLLLTLALAQAVYGLAFQQVAVTGGDNGISDITRESLPVSDSLPSYYWFTMVVVALSVVAMWTVMRSPVGMAVIGLRESESRLAATGYRVGAYRVFAFALSGAFSALAGLLDAYLLGSVSPSNLTVLLSAEVMVFAILGGAAYFFGPFLGAAVILSLEFYVSTYTDRWTVVLGIVYVVTALFMRDGMLGRLAWLRRRSGKLGRPTPRADRPPEEIDISPLAVGAVQERQT